MVTDWVSLARARGVPEERVEICAAAQDGLDRAFRRLAQAIPDEVEPAVIFHAEDHAG